MIPSIKNPSVEFVRILSLVLVITSLTGCARSPAAGPTAMDSNSNPDARGKQSSGTSAVEIFDPDLTMARIPEQKDSEEGAAFLQQLDQDLVSQARQVAGVADALGDQADEVFARMDRARAAALQQWMEQAQAGALAFSSQSFMPASGKSLYKVVSATAQTSPTLMPVFIVALSPAGFSQKVLDWENKFPDEYPASETAVDKEHEGVKVTTKVFKRMEGDYLVVDAKLSSTLSPSNLPGVVLTEVIEGRIRIQVCPDAAGTVNGNLSIQTSSGIEGSFSGGTKFEGVITGSVDDEAVLVSLSEQINASTQVTRVEPGGDHGGVYGEATLDVRFDKGSSGNMEVSNATGGEVRKSSDMSSTQMSALQELAFLYVHWLSLEAIEEAENFWRNGYCVEVIVVDPAGGKKEGLLPRAEQPLTAEVRHRRGGDPVVAPIEAWMASGETSVAPSNQRIPSPATFTYTAPPDKDSAGTVGLRTVSKRGIAEAEAFFNTYLPEFLLTGKITGNGVDLSAPYYTYTGQLFATFLVELKPVQKAGGLMWEGTGPGELSISQEFHDILYHCSSNVTIPISMQVQGIFTDGELWVNYFYTVLDLKYFCWFSFAPFEAPFSLANEQTFVFGVNDTVFSESTDTWPFGPGEDGMTITWEVEARRK
ncbi:MAG: hypothetical protein ACYC6H_04065 [Bellilinea sp.]